MKEMKIAYLSSAYLAPVEYYTKLLAYDKVFVEQHDHYIKQTYRNRCTIAGPSGELALSIPTVKPDTLKCPMKDIRISDHGNWRHLHWNTIESAYNSTPFFEYYKDDFRPFYEKKYEFLIDFTPLWSVLANIRWSLLPENSIFGKSFIPKRISEKWIQSLFRNLTIRFSSPNWVFFLI